MAETLERSLKWVPLVVLFAGLVASSTTAQLQISANAGEVLSLIEDLEEVEDDVEQIRRILIQRQGEVSQQVQRIELQQQQQSKDLDTILELLRDLEVRDK